MASLLRPIPSTGPSPFGSPRLWLRSRSTTTGLRSSQEILEAWTYARERGGFTEANLSALAAQYRQALVHEGNVLLTKRTLADAREMERYAGLLAQNGFPENGQRLLRAAWEIRKASSIPGPTTSPLSSSGALLGALPGAIVPEVQVTDQTDQRGALRGALAEVLPPSTVAEVKPAPIFVKRPPVRALFRRQSLPTPIPPARRARARCFPGGIYGYQPGVDCRMFAIDARTEPRAGVAYLPKGAEVELLERWYGTIPRSDARGVYSITALWRLARYTPPSGPAIVGWMQDAALFPL